MRRLTLEGVTPAEAARAALSAPELSVPARDGRPADAHRPGRSGGRVLSLPGAPATVRGLGRAAMALDAPAVNAILQLSIEEIGVTATWEGLLCPVLSAIGRRWEQTREGMDVEHLLVECATVVLHLAVARHQRPRRHRPVLLACVAGERHSLPLQALAAALAEDGLATRMLGADVPDAALTSAARRLGPAVVFVHAVGRQTGPGPLADVPMTRPRTALIAGGPGWASAELPARVLPVRSLQEAATAVVRAIGG